MRILSTRLLQAPYLVFWFAVFGAAAGIALIVQLIALPYLFPGLHAGNGLLAGGDWVGFHQLAAGMAGQIRSEGWSAWELSPYGHLPVGIAGAIYALTVPEPYVLIPLNAALHATAGVALMRITHYLTGDYRAALCAALPFVLFPSAMAWYAQIHKDGFYFAGAFLCLYGWILLARLPTWQADGRAVLAGLAWLGAGLALMGLVRTFAFQIMQGMGFVFAAGLTVLFIVRGAKKILPWKTCAAAIALLFLVPALLRLAPSDPRLNSELPPVVTSAAGASPAPSRWYGEAFSLHKWRPSGWLPPAIENNFLRLSLQREAYIFREPQLVRISGSMIDADVRLLNINEFFSYLPRAAQVGLLAPFPSHWLAPGHSPGGSLMRRLAGAEMIGVYCALLFLPYALWHWRRKVEMWLSVTFGGILVLIYAYATPNLGSLYRQRYGFLMLLVALGIAGAAASWRRIFRHNSV